MKIAFVYDAIYPFTIGGVEKRIWELSRRLVKHGHDVHIFGMKFWEGEDCIRKEGVFIHGVCPAKNLYHGDRRSITEALWFGGHVFLPLLKHGRFDVIDCQSFPYFSCFPAKLVSILKKTKLIITWHEVWGDYWYEYLGWRGVFGKFVELLVSRLTPHNIAVSETTKRQLQGLGVNTEIAIVPNGINYELIQRIPPSDKKSDIIFVGRLIKEKHVDVLIEALSILIKDFPNLICFIVGRGPEESKIRKMVEELQLEKNIRFKGFLSDNTEIIALMKSSKVFVLPSTREGFGMVALEAMACGIPVVTVKHPGNAVNELIISNMGGCCQLLPEDIAKKITLFLDDKYEIVSIQSNSKFNWNQIINGYERFP